MQGYKLGSEITIQQALDNITILAAHFKFKTEGTYLSFRAVGNHCTVFLLRKTQNKLFNLFKTW
jgi:hypothetical protein